MEPHHSDYTLEQLTGLLTMNASVLVTKYNSMDTVVEASATITDGGSQTFLGHHCATLTFDPLIFKTQSLRRPTTGDVHVKFGRNPFIGSGATMFTRLDGLTDRHTDRHTDGQSDYLIPPAAIAGGGIKTCQVRMNSSNH